MAFPTAAESVICLTEESVETLYRLGLDQHIAGVSAYVKRPAEAKKKPIVSAFTHAKIQQIVGMRPDLVLGYSDIQKDIARDLIAEGLEVYIAHHRSLAGILSYIVRLGAIMGAREQALRYAQQLEKKLLLFREKGGQLARRPRVYFEEWDGPHISASLWVSQLIEAAGGQDIFATVAESALAKGRIVTPAQVAEANPDIIFACWCGKKADLPSIKQRPQHRHVAAIQGEAVFELDPAIFLQPGPAVFEEGLDILFRTFENVGNA